MRADGPGIGTVTPAERRAQLSGPASPAIVSKRDHRADFFRGISLLFILWNHVFWAVGGTVPLLLRFTPIHWGFASSTEAFVFLSGYVYGMVYLKVAEVHGTMAVWWKSGMRAWQLYVANVVAMVLSLGAVSWWATYGPGPTAAVRTRMFLDTFILPDTSLFWDLVQLYRVPWGFDVLALYIVLLLLGPAYIMMARRRVWLAAVVGVALYGLAQYGLNLPSGHAQQASWYFNPFAWQLLFLCGILVGVRQLSVPRKRWLTLTAGATIGVVAAWVLVLPWVAPYLPVGSGTAVRMLNKPVPWQDPTNLEPVRLLYFLVLASFVAALTNRSSPVWTSGRLRPVMMLGQFSLEVFCFGLVYTYAVALVLPSLGADWPLTALAGLIGCVLSVGFAYTLRARRSAQTLLNDRGGSSARFRSVWR